MPTWQNFLVLASSVAFILFLLAKMRPTTFPFLPASSKHTMRGVLEQAQRAITPRERAMVLRDAGDRIAIDPRHITAAIGYYLRAMRADPTWVDPIDQLATLLQQRPQKLERLLWRRLAQISWSGPTQVAAAHIAYRIGTLRHGSKFRQPQRVVLRRLSAMLNPNETNDSSEAKS